MEASKALLTKAIGTLRTFAVEYIKASVSVGPEAEQVKAMGGKMRDLTAHVVAVAHILSAGIPTLKTMTDGFLTVGDSDTDHVKKAKRSISSRLSEANKIRKNHPEIDTLAALWAEGTADGFSAEKGYTVKQALKDVARPGDPQAVIVKAVQAALKAGQDSDQIDAVVQIAIREYEVAQEFLADTGESEQVAKAA